MLRRSRALILATGMTLMVGCGGTTITSDGGVDASPDVADAAVNAAAASAISAGTWYTCAVVAGSAICWGQDDNGEVDVDGGVSFVQTPTHVVGLPTIRAVATAAGGGAHTCAVSAANDLYCWGSNLSGEVGNGSRSNFPPPATKITTLQVNGVVACGEAYTCAADSNGVSCWGAAGYQSVQTDAGYILTPTIVQGAPAATRIAASDRTSCVVANSEVWCWGDNTDGDVGDGTTAPRASPMHVNALTGASAVATGSQHTCAVASGKVWCWGNNDRGQLGDNKAEAMSSSPIAVQGVDGAVDVCAGLVHSCAITSAGQLYCWGANDWGNLGDGTTIERDTPVLIGGVPNVTAVSCGYAHTCAIANGGKVFCWGDDTFGEIGDEKADGGTRFVTTPTEVVAL